MVLALVVLPLLIWVIKPKFLGDKDILVLGEGSALAMQDPKETSPLQKISGDLPEFVRATDSRRLATEP